MENIIEIDKLVIRVHNKIAIWNNNNSEPTQKAIELKSLSHEIVTDIISAAFSGIQGVKMSEKVVPSTQKKNKWFSWLSIKKN